MAPSFFVVVLFLDILKVLEIQFVFVPVTALARYQPSQQSDNYCSSLSSSFAVVTLTIRHYGT